MAFEFVNKFLGGLFGGNHAAKVKSGPNVIPTQDHPIFGGVRNIFPGHHENPIEPLPPSRHVFGTGVPVHSPLRKAGPQQ